MEKISAKARQPFSDDRCTEMLQLRCSTMALPHWGAFFVGAVTPSHPSLGGDDNVKHGHILPSTCLQFQTQSCLSLGHVVFIVSIVSIVDCFDVVSSIKNSISRLAHDASR